MTSPANLNDIIEAAAANAASIIAADCGVPWAERDEEDRDNWVAEATEYVEFLLPLLSPELGTAAEREDIARIIDGHIDVPVSSRLAIARALQGNGYHRRVQLPQGDDLDALRSKVSEKLARIPDSDAVTLDKADVLALLEAARRPLTAGVVTTAANDDRSRQHEQVDYARDVFPDGHPELDAAHAETISYDEHADDIGLSQTMREHGGDNGNPHIEKEAR